LWWNPKVGPWEEIGALRLLKLWEQFSILLQISDQKTIIAIFVWIRGNGPGPLGVRSIESLRRVVTPDEFESDGWPGGAHLRRRS